MKYRKGFLYQLAEDEYFQTEIYPEEHINTNFIEMTGKGLLRVKRGYAWDGPSGPTFNTKSSMRGSLIHDALYQYLKDIPIKRKQADKIYLTLLKDFKPKYIYYILLRALGWYSFI